MNRALWIGVSSALLAFATLHVALPLHATFAQESAEEQTDSAVSDDPAASADPAPTTEPSPQSEAAASTEGEADPQAVLAGHSFHGEAFNEGPRQKAYLMEGTGKVHFPATTDSAEAQQFIDQGVGQLHGFWYFEAERSFRQAAMLDPDCAIAYWGMARANTNNETRAKGFIEEAVDRLSGASQREAMYIDALATYLKTDSAKKKERAEKYADDLEQIVLEFPDDIEAKAFLALQHWNNRTVGIKISSPVAIDALIGQVLAVEPMHPVHHYRIHLWDDRRASKALPDAALCGQSAPAIAHMWHMPGHIYSKLKRYEDACWQQEASARVDHAHMMRDHVMPDQIHNFAHNNEWFIRNLVHVGRVGDAVDLAKNMIELPRHPRYNTLGSGSANYGRRRLFEVLRQYELWDEMVELCNTAYLDPTDVYDQQVERLRHLGTAQFRLGDVDAGQATLAELEQRLATARQEQDAAIAAAESKATEEGKNEQEIEKAKEEASKGLAGRISGLEKDVKQMQGELAAAQGDYSSAVQLLDESKQAEKLQVARFRLLAGDEETAEKDVRGLVRRNGKEVLPQAVLVDVLWQRGKKDEAAREMEKLREMSGSIDVRSPVFERLAAVAAELGLGDDWRRAKHPADDVGQRPELDSLGPFRWEPSPAPSWVLHDAHGKEHSLHDYHGRPVVVIFYLGYSCLHCAEQLQAFAPMAAKFEESGISLIAISSDDEAGLKRSHENYKDGTFPFPLVSDESLDVFRAYRAYDDFEEQVLHGTFLIDEQGRVRWQDISYEPFMDPTFVLNEAKRLLAQSKPASAEAAQAP